jgi:hypothetical protein
LPIGTRAGLKGFRASLAAAARHALYKFAVLAVLVLCLKAHVDPAVIAAVGCFLGGGGNFRRSVA